MTIFDSVRLAYAQDAEQLTVLFQQAYGDSSHPCQETAYVRRFLQDEQNIYVVAVCEGAVVAGMGVTYHRWHDACEWSHGITHPTYRRAGLAETLTQKAHGICRERRQGELFFGLPRGRETYKIGTETIQPRMIATGYDGGMNIANGVRETHFTLISRLPHAQFQHITPPVDELTHSPVVRETIWQPLDLRPNPGEYPILSFVGPPHHPSDSLFAYSFDPTCRSRALAITGYAGDQTQPRQIRQELETLLQSFPTAQHISADVLADKVNLIREMRELGFAITAYLPAWYKCGNARYDCVKLVQRRFTEEPVTHGFAPLIAGFQEQYAQLFVNRRGSEASV